MHIFELLGDKAIESPAQRQLALWNPTMDLMVYGLADNSVNLYRLNGQKVWHLPKYTTILAAGRKKEHKVTQICWRPDGKLLAISYDNSITRIIDVQTGKVGHQVEMEGVERGRITCIGWVDNQVHNKPANVATAEKQQSQLHSQSQSQLQPVLRSDIMGLSKKLGAAAGGGDDLSYISSLFNFDICQMLPKLSTLPGVANVDVTFSLKATLDSLINNPVIRDDDTMDVLLMGTSRGQFVLNIFDSFVIGAMDLAGLADNPNEKFAYKITHHGATPTMKTHLLLTTSKPKSKGKSESKGPTILHALDLLFLSSYGPHLSRVTYTITRVQHVIRYVHETILGMANEFKQLEAVSTVYMRAHAEIMEAPEDTSGLEFFELLVTGCISEKMKEWLLDSLGDKGCKRWEKVGMNGYETLRRLVHEHLFQACDRLIVLLSKLRGLARWTDKDTSLGLDPVDYSKLMDLVAGLLAVGHEFLAKLNTELDLFTAFIHWLKGAYDEFNGLSEGNEPPAHPTDDAMIDTLKVAEYIGKFLQKSHLGIYFDKSEWTWKEGESAFEAFSKSADVEEKSKEAEGEEAVTSLISGTGSGVSKKRESVSSFTGFNPSQESVVTPENQKPIPGFHQISARIQEVSKSIFNKPAEAMKQQLRLGQSVVIHDKPWDIFDMRVSEENEMTVCYMAMSENPERQHGKQSAQVGGTLVMIRIEIVMNGNLSSVQDVSCSKITVPIGKIVSGMKFVDNTDIVVLLYDEDMTSMVQIPYVNPSLSYMSAPSDVWNPMFNTNDSSTITNKGVYNFALTIASEEIPKYKRYIDFPHSNFTPVGLSVNGAANRRILSVLDRDRVRWQAFDIGQIGGYDDDTDEEGGEDDIEEEMADEANDSGVGFYRTGWAKSK